MNNEDFEIIIINDPNETNSDELSNNLSGSLSSQERASVSIKDSTTTKDHGPISWKMGGLIILCFLVVYIPIYIYSYEEDSNYTPSNKNSKSTDTQIEMFCRQGPSVAYAECVRSLRNRRSGGKL